MKIFTDFEDIKQIQATAIALGNFDGVHAGHRELIRQTVNFARENGLRAALFTFSNHPRQFVTGERVQNIVTYAEKQDIIANLGVDYLFNMEFGKSIFELSPQDFVIEILKKRMNMNYAFCGFNYHFGFGAQGTSETLYELGKLNDFGVTVLEPYKIEGHVVSSSLIRKLIIDGRVDECQKYLGRYYSQTGRVEVGNKIGKSFGFPTCNICPDESMVLPSNGVYVSFCTCDGVRYPAVSNVGVRPTIGEHYKRNVETHIFNFNQILYGKVVKVEFIKKLRDEIKFDNRDDLIAQIGSDAEKAYEYHMRDLNADKIC